MLGNWSFGDYFKEEAVRMAFECLTKTYGLDPDRLYATYFGGDEDKAPGVPADEETKNIWLKYLPKEKVLPFDAGDNFWEMGDTGPCGPCTEIHYDRIGGRDASQLVNMDDPDVLEIWNNVFIQYNRDSSGLKSLPNKHVDTGMGFERLASILQGKMSNYDTDVFTPLFAEIQSKIKDLAPYGGKIGEKAQIDTAYRVVADHVRTLSFAIADGAVPDKLGRGYVLRRVLRRAVWYGQRFLKAPKGGFVASLVPALCRVMGDAFPELRRSEKTIIAVLEGEEADFNRTIDKGAKFFSKKADQLLEENTILFSGNDAFYLSATLGFPLDLTEIMCEERGLKVDKDGYQLALDDDKAKNAEALLRKKASRSSAADMTFAAEQTAALSDTYKVEKTETEAKYVWHQRLPTTVKAIFKGRGTGKNDDGFDDFAKANDQIGVVLEATSFYAEMGGQCADSGELLVSNDEDDDACVMEVEDVQTYGGYSLHIGVAKKDIKIGDKVECAVDYDRRAKIAPNHTMTHVLNYALREVLMKDDNSSDENKCAQRGSFVDDERLRFDFSWDAPLSETDLRAVEKICKSQIDEAREVDARETPLSEALAIPTLRHMKGESYPDPVRVIAVGAKVSELVSSNNVTPSAYSIELCGGTHLRNTADAVGFAVLEETGIAKGVRRIVAATRDRAAAAVATATRTKETLASLEVADPKTEEELAELEQKVKDLRITIDTDMMPAADKIFGREKLAHIIKGPIMKAQKLFAAKKAELAAGTFEVMAAKAEKNDSEKKNAVIARVDFGCDPKLWQKLHKAHLAKPASKNNSFLVVTADTDKFAVYATSANPDLLDAKQWTQAVADAAGGGKGGGKANSANFVVMGNLDRIDDAIDAGKQFINSINGLTLAD